MCATSISALLTGFILPMCSNACFGHIIHFFGTYLYLNIHAIGTKQHGVQGLIAIGLGDCDIVLKFSRHRFVEVMYDTKRPITVVDIFDQDSKGVNIIDFIKSQFISAHLFVDAIQVFFPSLDLDRQFFLSHASTQRVSDFGNHLFSITTRLTHLFSKNSVAHWIHG